MTTKILHLEKYVADFSYTRQFQQNTDKIKSSITITEKVSVSKKNSCFDQNYDIYLVYFLKTWRHLICFYIMIIYR